MNSLYSVFGSLLAVVVLIFLVVLGVGVGLDPLFGIWIPYAAVAVFFIGIIYRVAVWASSPVPFRVPTTCGQQKTLPWIQSSYLESPHNALGVIGRMVLEVLLFRSLFRNTSVELRDQKAVYGSAKWLWIAGLLFHYAFLTIVLRHLRFFTEPQPFFIGWIQKLDSLFEIFVPVFYLTDAAIVLAVTYLFLRRVVIPRMRYLSLPADYFPLFLILGIAVSGILMRHIFKVDILRVKELAMGWVSFHPVLPEGIGLPFFIHLFLVSALVAYFPFSKLMHMAGVFLSPTRNLANNNRMKRHVNPWNYPVKIHTYEAYEDEFREKMKAVGLPVEKE